jgi:PAS domain S-box-containing protein
MLLNARRLDPGHGMPRMILLAIEDVTERLESRAAVKASEIRYRRLFETSQDGILILDSVSRKITDANPFIAKLLGYKQEELLGKELWQIGLLKDEPASHAAYRELQRRGSIRYDDLPLESKDGRAIQVEFVSNLYDENHAKVIQCNIREITERKRAEEALRQAHAELQSHADDVERFNRLAVGRELRMIELKKEVNELHSRQGRSAPYPLDFEQQEP